MPPSGAEAFVSGLYRRVLGRTPSAAEVAAWAQVLRERPGPGAAFVVAGFFNSPETLHRPLTLGGYVRLLYETVLQREPTDHEVAAWVDAGLVPALNAIVPGFVQSPEYQQVVARSSPSAIVAALYENVLGRRETPAENAAWVAWLAQGGTWEELALAFLDSPEYVGGTRSLAEHVAILYRTFLAREPDPAGLAGWLGVIVDGLGGVQAAFTGSAEFESRIAVLLR